jgi:hypothetical protein
MGVEGKVITWVEGSRGRVQAFLNRGTFTSISAIPTTVCGWKKVLVKGLLEAKEGEKDLDSIRNQLRCAVPGLVFKGAWRIGKRVFTRPSGRFVVMEISENDWLMVTRLEESLWLWWRLVFWK